MPSGTRLCHGLSSFVVTQISSRGTPESWIPRPTSCSLSYARALEDVRRARRSTGDGGSRVNVAITGLQGSLDCFADLVGLRLPRAQTNARHLGPGVEGEDLSAPQVSQLERCIP